MTMLIELFSRAFAALDRYGQGVALLGLRLLLAWEFWEAGWGKLQGENWFADIQSAFPFPFNLLPAEWSWALATWTELIAAALLALGLATRLGGLSLIVLTAVAWASVHAGHGYNVCDSGWKLPLIYLVMLMPLLFGGAGRLSLDYWIKSRLPACKSCRA